MVKKKEERGEYNDCTSHRNISLETTKPGKKSNKGAGDPEW